MRKALIAAVVAAALFAVGAFAASFAVESEDVASGTNAVDQCAARVDVDFTTDYNVTDKNWRVPEAVVKFLTEASGTETGCAGYVANLIVENEANVAIAQGKNTVGPGASTVTITLNPIAPATEAPLASAIGHAAVLVDGETLNVVSTGDGLLP